MLEALFDEPADWGMWALALVVFGMSAAYYFMARADYYRRQREKQNPDSAATP